VTDLARRDRQVQPDDEGQRQGEKGGDAEARSGWHVTSSVASLHLT
jgi:hypothetical protein